MSHAAFEAAFYYHVTNDVGVSALISNRFYPAAEIPSSAALPYANYQRISTRHIRHMTAGAGLVSSRYQVRAFGKSVLLAAQLADAFRGCIDMYSGDMGEAGSTVEVNRAFIENDFEDYVAPGDASQRGVYSVVQDFIIWHEESVTS